MTKVEPNMGNAVMQYAKKFGVRESRDLIYLIRKIMDHSLDDCWQVNGNGKMPYVSPETKKEIHETYSDIVNCRECSHKVNYCCRLHQEAVKNLQGVKDEKQG